MQSKKIEVQCLCEGTGFISQVDSGGEDTELVECAKHNPAHQDAPSVDELLSHLGKITGFDAADAERSAIIDNLTPVQEDKLKEAHAEDYHGTDDDMPDAFEGWLEDLSLDELKQILNV